MEDRAAIDPAEAEVCRLKSAISLPDPWDLGLFLDQLARTVDKPIRLVPQVGLAAQGFPCGMVVERVDDVVIIYESGGSSYHADHIVLHEVGHLLLGHTGAVSDPEQHAILGLLDDCDPASVLAVLQRTAYDTVQESQAELFASLVMVELRRSRPESAMRWSYFLH